MITREKFFKEFNGHENSYSSYLVIGTTADKVIEFLNQYDENLCIGSGVEENGNVSFEICKELPDLIYDITKALNTIGYADMDWDATYTVCAKNGEDFDDFTAEWVPDMFYYRGDFDEDDDTWDAFVIITDNQSGATFNTGAGAVDEYVMRYYEDMVNNH